MDRFQLRVAQAFAFEVTEVLSDDLNISLSLPPPDDPEPIISVTAKNLGIIDALYRWAQDQPHLGGLVAIAHNVEYQFEGRTPDQLKALIQGG
ncbi:MAG: hypothetical protein EXR60_03010 [Dehalococcoidia bacterium]|nr:hypothetical protein [Dehalococcoidia bacterium]